MSKLQNYLLKIFSSNPETTGTFGSMQDRAPHLTKDVGTLQSSDWEKGWAGAIIGEGAPPMQEWNSVLYVLSQSLAYVKQQGSITMEYNAQTTYYNGSMAGKIASSPLLGDHASKVTLVYRSLEDNNLGNVLPNDFITDDHWAFVDAVQPQSLNKLDFSGHVGEVRNTTAEETNIPINWGICDGRAITMPDGTTQETPDLRDKFLISASKGKVKGTSGGSWSQLSNRLRQPFDFSTDATHNATGGGWYGVANQQHGSAYPYIQVTTIVEPPYYALYSITRMF